MCDDKWWKVAYIKVPGLDRELGIAVKGDILRVRSADLGRLEGKMTTYVDDKPPADGVARYRLIY